MKIVEPDCYIECVNGIFQLYLLKNKKELKEDSTDQYKVGGYFMELDNAFKEVIRFRKHKKYAFKEDWKHIKLVLNTYLTKKSQFQNQLKQIYLLLFSKLLLSSFIISLFKSV